MGGPAELADRLDPIEAVAALAQKLRIAREGPGIAGNKGDPRRLTVRQFHRLFAGAGAGRIDDDGVEAGGFGSGDRAAEQVAVIGEDLAAGLRGGGL